MFYRILNAPPGYPDEQRYWLVEYRSLEFESSVKGQPIRWFTTIEQARMAIPGHARQLPWQQIHQFVELWELTEWRDSERAVIGLTSS